MSLTNVNTQRVTKLPPFSARERKDFQRGFNLARRRDASKATFKYRVTNKDVINPRAEARLIRRAVASDTPTYIFSDIEAGVHAMALCAGNIVSLDAPLDAQFLAAFQRIHDYHAGRLLNTPEELARCTALIFSHNALRQAVKAFEVWEKEQGKR